MSSSNTVTFSVLCLYLLTSSSFASNGLPSELGFDISVGLQSEPLLPSKIGQITSSPLLNGVHNYRFYGWDSDHDIAAAILNASASPQDITFYIGLNAWIATLSESDIDALVTEWDDLSENVYCIGLVNEPSTHSIDFSILPDKLNMTYAYLQNQSGWQHVLVSIPFSQSIFGATWPVPNSAFKEEYKQSIGSIMNIYMQYDAPFSVNIYPFFVAPYEPSLMGYILGSTAADYSSMMVAQYMATWYSMQQISPGNGLEIIITETGWSTDSSEYDFATLENAQTYYENTFRDMNDPTSDIYGVKIYAFQMFNEDAKTGGSWEVNWGIFDEKGEAKWALIPTAGPTASPSVPTTSPSVPSVQPTAAPSAPSVEPTPSPSTPSLEPSTSPSSQTTSPSAPGIPLTSAAQTIMNATNHIIIENVNLTQEWWVAMYISNEDQSCGGPIVNVEITDDNLYKNRWISYTERIFDGTQPFYAFDNDGESRFTPPISIRISTETETLIGYDIITNFNSGTEFDFGTNLCVQLLSTTMSNGRSQETDTKWVMYSIVALSVLLFVVIASIAAYYMKLRTNAQSSTPQDTDHGNPRPTHIQCEVTTPSNATEYASVPKESPLPTEKEKSDCDEIANEEDTSQEEQIANVNVINTRRRLSNAPQGRKEINAWLASIDLAQYVQHFRVNGYDSLEYIRDINDENDLLDIGITDKEHRSMLIKAICGLNGIDMDPDENESESEEPGCVHADGAADHESVDRLDVNHALQQWLCDLGLSQYLSNLVVNGFETLDFVKEIRNESQLNEIGIELKGHQIKIINAIQRLSGNVDPEEGNREGGKEGEGGTTMGPPMLRTETMVLNQIWNVTEPH